MLYCSQKMSEITSALPCKAVIRNSLTYIRSLWRTSCTKKMPSCMHMTSKRWSTGHSSARGRKNQQNLSNVLCSKSINTGSMVGASHLHMHPVQNSSRHLLAPWGHLHLPSCSPSPAPSPPWPGWATLQQGMSPPVCPPAPLPLFSYKPWLDFKWYQVLLLPQVPRPSACSIRYLQCRPLHLSESSHSPSQQLADAGISRAWLPSS